MRLDAEKSTYFDASRRDSRYAASADSAFRIMSALFSSAEFQDSLRRADFRCAAYFEGCADPAGARFGGAEVLDKLFQEQRPRIALQLHKSGNALGETSRKSYATTAWYENIREDMDDLPFAPALAVNLCHEYMHQVGFVHLYCTGWLFCGAKNRLRERNGKPNPRFLKDDVTYRVGFVAYAIIKRKLAVGEPLL